ncbi:MAG: glutathione S-transferase family protein [Myxococcota bacterium]
MTQTSDRVLYQFAFSHFNEKARWALDWKGLSCERRSLLPGPHARRIQKLCGEGRTQVPVLVEDGRVVAGSAAIVAHLDAIAPARPLFPDDPDARARAEEWIDWLDAEIGPAVRLALFHELLPDTRFASRVFGSAGGGPTGTVYRWLFPRLVPMLRQRMDIHEESAVKAREIVDAGLRRAAAAAADTGYLVGDRFGAADLTAASLFMPLFFPKEIPFEMPSLPSPAFEGWLARWRGHPGEGWIRELWARHRHPA